MRTLLVLAAIASVGGGGLHDSEISAQEPAPRFSADEAKDGSQLNERIRSWEQRSGGIAPPSVMDGTLLSAPVLAFSTTLETGTVLQVHVVNESKDTYSGKVIIVKGMVRFLVYHSQMPCQAGARCNTVMGGDMQLVDLEHPTGPNSAMLVLKNGKHILCQEPLADKDRFTCVDFKEGDVITIEGQFVKDREPASYIGGTSGQSPTVSAWREIHYLNIQ